MPCLRAGSPGAADLNVTAAERRRYLRAGQRHGPLQERLTYFGQVPPGLRRHQLQSCPAGRCDAGSVRQRTSPWARPSHARSPQRALLHLQHRGRRARRPRWPCGKAPPGSACSGRGCADRVTARDTPGPEDRCPGAKSLHLTARHHTVFRLFIECLITDFSPVVSSHSGDLYPKSTEYPIDTSKFAR